MGAASVSIRRLCAARDARSAFRAAKGTGRVVALTGEARTGLALAFYRRQGGVGPAALGGFLDRGVNLTKAPVEVGDLAGGHLDLGRKNRVLRLKDRRGLSPRAD